MKRPANRHERFATFRARRPTQGFCGRLSATTERLHWNLRLLAVLPRPILSLTLVAAFARGGNVHGSDSFTARHRFSPFSRSCTLFHSSALAQVASITGVVVDEAGSVIPGARVSPCDAKGAVVQIDPHRFIRSVYVTRLCARELRRVDRDAALLAASIPVTVSGDRRRRHPCEPSLAGGFAETVVVTARRAETRLAETPQKIEIVDAIDIERSVAADLTDVLKKNAGVDVVQYSGVLSGIGIRGFRPQNVRHQQAIAVTD